MTEIIGRPTKYKKEYDDLVHNYCLLGSTDKEIAGYLEVAESTLNLWKIHYQSFSDSMKKGKAYADSQVVLALYKSATGGHKVKETRTDENKGEVIVIEKVLAPNVSAQKKWLENRQRGLWKESIDIDVVVDADFTSKISQLFSERMNE